MSTECRHKLLFNLVASEHKVLIEYLDNSVPYSCVHIIENIVSDYNHMYGFSLKTVICVDHYYIRHRQDFAVVNKVKVI